MEVANLNPRPLSHQQQQKSPPTSKTLTKDTQSVNSFVEPQHKSSKSVCSCLVKYFTSQKWTQNKKKTFFNIPIIEFGLLITQSILLF